MPAIQVKLLNTEKGELISRFQNLGEDIYREVSVHASIDLHEIDQGADHFHIRDIAKRHFGTVMTMVTRLIRRHNFEGLVTLSRLP
jgi:hypothetical protein